MSKNPESKFSRWLVDSVLVHGDVLRIENMASSGTPDINYCFAGVEVWIETKMHENSRTLLRPYQWAWIRRRHMCKGRVFVISFVEQLDAIWIWDGWMTATKCGDKMMISSTPILSVKRSDPDIVNKVHFILRNSIPIY